MDGNICLEKPVKLEPVAEGDVNPMEEPFETILLPIKHEVVDELVEVGLQEEPGSVDNVCVCKEEVKEETSVERCVGSPVRDATRRDDTATSSTHLSSQSFPYVGDIFWMESMKMPSHQGLSVTGQDHIKYSSCTTDAVSTFDKSASKIQEIDFTSDVSSSCKEERNVHHTGDKPFQCTVCSARFSYRYALKRHTVVHSDDKHFQCTVCSASFKYKSALRNHRVTHIDEKLFQCTVCLASFKHSSTLKQHALTHTGEKPFQCKVCLASFSRSFTLKQHTYIHTGDKPFQCTLCFVKFKQYSSLKEHTLIHTGEKPWSCPICSSKFSRKTSLNLHVLTHQDKNFFSCAECSAMFKLKSHLVRHVRTHTVEKPFLCP